MRRLEAIQELVQSTPLEREALAKLFEEAAPTERVTIIEALDGRAQARIWQACEGRKVSIAELIPEDFEPLRPVIFDGKNSLPAFTRFQKRFCRPSDDTRQAELWGYNHQPVGWLAPLTGPGYFVAYDSENPLGGVAIDYRRIPPARPADWPEIRANTHRLSRFIFNGMIDYLRQASGHLLIGRATRGKKELPNYFLLCREDLES